MVIKYVPMQIKSTVADLLDDCEFVYRKHHPELNEMFLSKSKILYEVFKFYLAGTERKLTK